MNAEKKQALVAEYRHHEGDTGSVSVQVAIMTERINHLNEHFARFPKDMASRMGLMKLVGRRQKSLRYIKRTDKQQYEALIARLGLRK